MRGKAARWLRRGFGLALGCFGFAVLYACVLALCFVPWVRSLTVSLEGPAALQIWPDVGRNFVALDARVESVDLATRTHVVSVPFRVKRIRLVLVNAERGASFTGAWLGTRRGAVALALPESRRERRVLTFDPLPSVAADVPSWGYLATGVLCLVLVAPLASRKRRLWLGRICRLALRPRVVCTWRGALVAAALLCALSIAIRTSVDVYYALVATVDHPQFWPLSVFEPVWPSGLELGLALALWLGVGFGLRRLGAASRGALAGCLALGLTTLIAGNLLHGWFDGAVEPIVGRGSYWDTAQGMHGVREFLSEFTRRQPLFGTHVRTHPPGAVLVYLGAMGLGLGPGASSLLIGGVSYLVTCLCVFAMVRMRTGCEPALWATRIVAFIPAVQIYFIATLDGFVCACCTATLYCFLLPRPWPRVIGTAIGLGASTFSSFGALFLLPTLLLYELCIRRSLRPFLASLSLLAVGYFVLHMATGFDWVRCFGIAATLENRQGFMLFSSPANYAFSRLRCVAELAVFAGPLLLFGVWRGLRRARKRQRELAALALFGSLSVLAMFLTGAFKTGETARACLFVYPLLALPLATLTDAGSAVRGAERRVLLGALLVQSVAMQLFGEYHA